MRLRWTEEAVSDVQQISIWIERERNLDLANRMAARSTKALRVIHGARNWPDTG